MNNFFLAAKKLGASHFSPLQNRDDAAQLWRPSQRFEDSYAELTVLLNDDGQWEPIGDWYLFNYVLPDNAMKID